MSENQVKLKWNSFLNNIAVSFESLWEEQGLVDVTLASDGQCLEAHKVILSASSPFFKELFQKNPCQHPIIILQDVRYTEIETLLKFIYKGEVDIDQENLPALLKAAETLQIRGLTGEHFNTEDLSNHEILPDDLPNIFVDNTQVPKRKKLKVTKNHVANNKFSNKETSKKSAGNECSVEISSEGILVSQNSNDNAYQELQMKLEPFDVEIKEYDKDSPEMYEQSDTGQPSNIENNAERDILADRLDGTAPLLYPYQHLAYAHLLPGPDVISAWAESRPIDHLACDLMKILFTAEERINCNVNGKMGKKQFDSNKVHLIREVLLHFSGIEPNSAEWDETWKNCVIKIDTSNRGLKRYLSQRRSVYTR